MTIQEFIAECDAYCEAAGRTRVWLSKRLLSDTTKLDDLASGKVDIGVKRLERAYEDLRQLETERHTPGSAAHDAAA